MYVCMYVYKFIYVYTVVRKRKTGTKHYPLGPPCITNLL